MTRPMTHRVAPIPGQPLSGGGGFRLEARLAEGGMGAVWSAEHVDTGRSVVAKINTPRRQEALADAELRMRREARATAIVAGPGVPSILGLGRAVNGQPVIYLERIAGRVWRHYIGSDGRLTAPTGTRVPALDWHLEVLCEVARVIERAHELDVVHRDLKPGNVMVSDAGRVFVMDWGLAVSARGRHPLLPRPDTIDRISGTTGHMAPEMVSSSRGRIGVATDVYLLGTCLRVILTGRPPHDLPTVRQRLHAALRSEPLVAPDRPRALVQIANRAMARRPADRFRSAASFREAVAAVLAQRRSDRAVSDAHALVRSIRETLRRGAAVVDVEPRVRRCRALLGGVLAEMPDCVPAIEGLATLRQLLQRAGSRRTAALSTDALHGPLQPTPPRSKALTRPFAPMAVTG